MLHQFERISSYLEAAPTIYSFSLTGRVNDNFLKALGERLKGKIQDAKIILFTLLGYQRYFHPKILAV